MKSFEPEKAISLEILQRRLKGDKWYLVKLKREDKKTLLLAVHEITYFKFEKYVKLELLNNNSFNESIIFKIDFHNITNRTLSTFEKPYYLKLKACYEIK